MFTVHFCLKKYSKKWYLDDKYVIKIFTVGGNQSSQNALGTINPVGILSSTYKGYPRIRGLFCYLTKELENINSHEFIP